MPIAIALSQRSRRKNVDLFSFNKSLNVVFVKNSFVRDEKYILRIMRNIEFFFKYFTRYNTCIFLLLFNIQSGGVA